MIFLQYWQTLLLVLRLREFLSPNNLCFLVDENQLESEFWHVCEIVETGETTQKKTNKMSRNSQLLRKQKSSRINKK